MKSQDLLSQNLLPLKLIEKASRFSKPIEFSFEKHPLNDFENFRKESKKILKKLENFHNKSWNKYQKDIKMTFEVAKELARRYGNFIVKSLEKVTELKRKECAKKRGVKYCDECKLWPCELLKRPVLTPSNLEKFRKFMRKCKKMSQFYERA